MPYGQLNDFSTYLLQSSMPYGQCHGDNLKLPLTLSTLNFRHSKLYYICIQL
jgi:hypothetical protein